ncbi:MAG: TCP-1/cpn60 chaperonin family protein [Candidatus Korarchaeota archaeon]|nr:TCP-1/cpn60 chaperonin family protein [Candidatus Korarchaeota archaeon]
MTGGGGGGTSEGGTIPVLILKEGTSRTRGREALRLNITVAKAIADTIRTTLSPKGMQKMLVDPFGDVIITHDGATIMKEIEVEHPTAKMMVDLAKSQEQEAGDGTTTVVLLAGELLAKAEDLLDMGIHPTVIISGYRKAAERVKEFLKDVSFEVAWNDRELLKKVAKISMSSKSVAVAQDYLADLVVNAALQVVEERDGKRIVDLDNIKLEKKEGGSLFDTKLIKGIVVDKEVVHPRMPRRIENAKIALIESALEVKKPELSSKIRVTSPAQVKEFLDQEKQMLAELVEKIAEAGANVVFCQKGIDDVAQHFLAKHGILAVRRVRKSDMEKLAKATGAKIVVNVKEIAEKDLGYADLVEERRVGEDKMVFVEGCKDPRAVSILIRGGEKQVIDEAERNLHDALSVVRNVIEDARIVVGAGAVWTDLVLKLRDYAVQLGGKEQNVVEKFAEAIESIPKTLIENAGHDPIVKLSELKKAHAEGKKEYGFNIYTGDVENMYEKDIIEPERVVRRAILSAAEFATTILKIDDIIAAAGKKFEPGKSKGEE